MKKIIYITLLCFMAIGITACTPKQTITPVTDTKPSITDTVPPHATTEPATDLATLCANEKGNWLSEYQECEYVSAEWCQTNGGKFNGCDSACRHDPKAEVCTENCVIVCEFGKTDTNKPVQPDATEPPIVGGDKDEHGCIGSAGYQWCANKNKCLRIWEESCYPEITSAIQQAFMTKYNKPESEVHVTVTQSTDTHARGGVKFGDGSGAGGNFLATMANGKWEIVFDGNGGIACKDLEQYQFPEEMIKDFCSE